MADKSIAYRLSLKDGELVRAALERVGKDGEAAIRRLDKAARDASAGGLASIGASVNKIEANISRLGGLIGAGSFAGLVTLGRKAIESAGSLGEMAEQLGLNTDQLQVYQYVATQTGVRQEELGNGFAKLTRLIGEARDGNTAALDTFERLGIKILDASGKARSAGDVFEEAADIIAAMPDQAQRATAAFDLLGKTGQKMVPALSGGSDALRRYADEARAAGLVWTPEMIARADQVADQLAALELQATKLAQTLALDGGLIEGMQALVDFVNGKSIEGDGLLAGVLRSTRQEIEALGRAFDWLDKQAEEQHGRDFPHLRPNLNLNPRNRIDPNYEIDDVMARAERLPVSVPLPGAGVGGRGGASNPRSARAIEEERKLQEQIRKTTEALAAQADQYGRTAQQRAVYDALGQAGIKTSDAEIKAARELLATYPEFASERDKAIVQIADIAAANYRKGEAEKAATDATREHEREQKRLTEAQKKASESVDEMLTGLQEEQSQLRLSERDRYIRQKSLEAERKLLEAGLPLQDARIDKIREEAGATYDLNKAVDEAKRAREEWEREAQKQAEEQRELLLEPYREAWRSIQQLGASALEQMFDGGLDSAKDFWKSFLNIAKKTLIQIASAEITVAIQGVFGTSGAPGAAGGGGLSGILGQIFGGGSSPVAGTGNLPTSGGGLFGGGGGGLFGGFLSRPLSSFGIGSPGLDPTGASAYLGLAESGGFGGFLGDLSLGQGLGALGGAIGGISQLMQGGGIGNTIGGITSLIGAGVSLIPGVGQILGPILSIAGPIIGGLFGKKKKKFPRSRFSLLTTGGDMSRFEPGGSPTVTTPFGTLGYNEDGSNERFTDSDAAGPYLQALADIDKAMADLLTPEQIALVSAALNGAQGREESFRDDPNGREFFAATHDRLQMVMRSLYGADVANKGFSGIARSDENIEQLAERAVDIISLKNAIADFGKEATDAEEAVRGIQKQFAEMKANAEAWGFSAADIAAIEAERKRTLNALAGDINKNITDALLGFTDPFALAQQQLLEAQDKRRQEALYLNEQVEAGVLDTLVDINKLEELFGKERAALAEQALDAIGASWQGFVDEMTFGPLSAKSNREQYQLAMGEFNDVRTRAVAAFAANDNLDPALAAEFQNEARLALQWSRTYNASSAATAQLYQQILDLARQFGDLDVPGFAAGGTAGPGLIEVGERGRELIRLFQPARIYSNAESNSMFGGEGAMGNGRLLEFIEQLARMMTGNQSQMMQGIASLIEQIVAQRRDAEIRGATQAATAPIGPAGVSRLAARR